MRKFLYRPKLASSPDPHPEEDLHSTVWVAVTAEMLKQALSCEQEQNEAWQNVSIVTEEQG